MHSSVKADESLLDHFPDVLGAYGNTHGHNRYYNEALYIYKKVSPLPLPRTRTPAPV